MIRSFHHDHRRSSLSLLLWVCISAGVLTVFPAAGVELETVVRGLSRPLFVTHAGDGSGRLFIVEQGGRIRILESDRLRPEVFLDISDEISTGGERGLLGLAFHPRYAENGLFFVYYTDRSGGSVVSRFAVSPDPYRADRSSETEVLAFRQPFDNHNGGHLAFGPDGYLYIGSGDGGGAGDPQNNGQSLDTLLGKILRIDVDGLPVAIPPDNPFVGRSGAKSEIWAYGLRNPWRFSFDRRTGDLFIGDVGQGRQEEIDLQPAASRGGENYGWRRKEGNLCYEPAAGCDIPSLVDPILVYGHDAGCSVTGGYRYRGSSNAVPQGTYVFGDFCSGTIWGAERSNGGTWSVRVLAQTALSIASFGEDEAGEIYVVDLGGKIQRLAGSGILVDDFEDASTDIWRATRGAVEVVQPGLGGSEYAVRVTTDGTRARSMLVTSAVRRQDTLSVRLLLLVQDLQLSGGEIEIVRLAGQGGGPLVRLSLEAQRATRLAARLWVDQAEGGPILVGSTTVRAGREIKLGFDWQRSSSPGATDGVVRLIRGRKVRAEANALADGASSPRSLRIGLPSGSLGADSGSLIFDDVEISR